MQPDTIKQIIHSAFRKSFERKDIGKNRISNPIRSATFVSNLGKGLKDFFAGRDRLLLVQDVDDLGKKHKGEWMLDIALVELGSFNYSNSKESYYKHIICAVESEFNTSLKSFQKDFSKLVNVNANCYLYINGINQRTAHGRREYIDSRISIARHIVHKTKKKNFHISFVPSPRKLKDASMWDKYKAEELEKWIHVERLDSR